VPEPEADYTLQSSEDIIPLRCSLLCSYDVGLKRTENIVGSSGNVGPLVCNILYVCDYVKVEQSGHHDFAGGKAAPEHVQHATPPAEGSLFYTPSAYWRVTT
jgi:hypothetical protein